MQRANFLLREAMFAAGSAASLAALLFWLGPPGNDLAAHVYQRTVFIHHGFQLWNNFWYGGRYSFVTYSVLYYPLAGILGIKVLAVASIATAALAFAVVVGRQWGPLARWSSRTFGVVWAGLVISAAFPFALGIALGLLSIWALQAGKRWRFGILAVLTAAASPLAFLLLAIFLAGIALSMRERGRRLLAPALVVDGSGRDRVPAGPRLLGRWPLSVLGLRARRCPALLRARCRLDLARRSRADDPLVLRRVCRDLRRRLRGRLAARGEHRTGPLRSAPDCGSRPLTPQLAARVGRGDRPRARGLVEPQPSRLELLSGDERALCPQGILATGGQLPEAAPHALVPRRGSRHVRALGRGLPSARGHPAHPWLVPAGRLPAERGALRPVGRADLPALAAPARGALRRADRRADRLQLEGRGPRDPQRPLGSHPRAANRAHRSLRGTASATSHHGPRAGRGAHACTDLHAASRRCAGPLSNRRSVLALLGSHRVLASPGEPTAWCGSPPPGAVSSHSLSRSTPAGRLRRWSAAAPASATGSRPYRARSVVPSP